MKEKGFAKNPLLYIEQPTIGKPKAPMQQDYFTPKETEVTIKRSETPKTGMIVRPYKRSSFYEEEQAFQEQEKENNLISQELEESNPDKKFKAMTLREKVDYFVEIPDHILKVKCEVLTDTKKYQGVITDFQDDYVYIRIGRRTTNEKVEFSQIKSIRMLGF